MDKFLFKEVACMTDPLIALTCQLICFASTNPENVNLSADYCANWLNKHGVCAQLLENQGLNSVVATIGNNGPTIILNGHLDVVPGRHLDFTPRIEDGKIIGRGSYDMLGAVAAMMFLATELAAEPPPCRVILTLVPDEEKGGKLGTGFLVGQGVVGDFVICGEPTNLDVAVQAKGILQLNIDVPGVAAHGSRSWLGKNAILAALESYKAIEALELFQTGNGYFTKPSINLAKIRAGLVYNQVPDSCMISLDIRYLPGQNPQDILRSISKVAPETKITVVAEEPAVETNPENKYVEQLKINTEAILGRKVKLFGQDGSADTRFYTELKIPAVEFGPVGANHHGPEEYVVIESLYVFKKILKQFIMNIDKCNSKER